MGGLRRSTRSIRTTLDAGERLLIYSDGVPERWIPDNRQFGNHRLMEALHDNTERIRSESVDLVEIRGGRAHVSLPRLSVLAMTLELAS